MTPTPDADAGLLFRPGADLADEVVAVPAPRSGAEPGEPENRRRWVGPLVCAVLALVAVLRVTGAAVRLPPLPVESRLVDGAYAMLAGLPIPGGGPGEVAARLQLAAHAALTGAFDRYPDVSGGARELAVVAFVVLLGAVAAVVRPGALAVLLALFVVADPAVTAVATFRPGLLGAMWLAVGGALLVRRAAPARIAGAVAVLAGVLTAPEPVVVVVLVIALVAARDLRTAALGATAVAIVLGGVLLLLRGTAAAPTTWWVPLFAAVVVVIGLTRRDHRRAAVALAGAVLLVALAGDTAVPLLVAGVLVVGSMVVGSMVGDVLRSGGGAVAVAAWVGLAAVVLPTAWAGPGPGRPHRELAAWIATSSDAVLAVPPGVWSDLLRDGVPAGRLGTGGTLLVTEGASTAQDRLARFGTGPAQLTVLVTTPTASIPEGAARARAGVQLAANPRLDAPDDVRTLLRSGGVDSRALVVLAGLAGRGDVVVTTLPVVAGEDPARPRHQVVLDGADTATVDWLRAQQPPFASRLTVTPDGLTLTWPLPAPTSVFGR